MKSSAEKALREPQESFAALAAAVSPSWHQAIIRLANAAQSIDEKLTVMMREPGNIQKRSRDLIESLINFLDMVSEDPDLEPSCGVAYGQPPGADECEPPEDAEPSLGSPDRALDQTRWCAGSKDDLEVDDCDREDDDPDEAKQQPPEMCPCA
ncbi:hypothetical protein [Bradyrhizobium sp. 191]|uniref:hypothetical protein n=1 Tax=Bradyrhizobium sp. 191 TaxID=2782659 RepID=UPI001FFE65B2|nr:hypothetical protein [Bradyrhizobium sp. 191]UPJ65978.1 hypothetical protein IVB23_00880 [Bradyrhizobium sp. 191]